MNGFQLHFQEILIVGEGKTDNSCKLHIQTLFVFWGGFWSLF